MTTWTRRAIAAMLSAGTLLGCAVSEDELAATRDALDDLEVELQRMPELDDATADYGTTTPRPLPDTIRVVAQAADGVEVDAELVDTVARRTWESSIPDISRLSVQVDHADGRRAQTTSPFDSEVLARRELQELFGPREGG